MQEITWEFFSEYIYIYLFGSYMWTNPVSYK